MNVLILGPGLGFGQTNAPELWIDEHRVGHEPAVGRPAALLDEVRAENAKVVVGDMRKRRATLDVAQRNTPGAAGLERSVDVDEAMASGRNSGGGEVQRIAVRSAPGGDEQVRPIE